MYRYLPVCFALATAALFPATAHAADQIEGPVCSLENIASAEEIKGGWTLKFDPKIVEQSDSAPVEQGKGNWFITRTTTTIPQCSAYDEMGNYSLRSYMMPKVTTVAKIQICQATPDGGSTLAPPAPGTQAQPPDTAAFVFTKFNRPYSGICPPK